MKVIQNLSANKFVYIGGALLPHQTKNIPDDQAKILLASFPKEVILVEVEEEEPKKKSKK